MSVIVAACRTPVGRAFKGSLAGVRPDDLAAQAIAAALARVEGLDPATIDDVICGAAWGAGEQGMNLGRVAGAARRAAGHRSPARPSTGFCASSLQAIRMAHHAITAGEGRRRRGGRRGER